MARDAVPGKPPAVRVSATIWGYPSATQTSTGKERAVDFNEIKNRAKDIIADLTEPRTEQEARPAPGATDDPAARTDRLDDPTGRRESPQWTPPGAARPDSSADASFRSADAVDGPVEVSSRRIEVADGPAGAADRPVQDVAGPAGSADRSSQSWQPTNMDPDQPPHREPAAGHPPAGDERRPDGVSTDGRFDEPRGTGVVDHGVAADGDRAAPDRGVATDRLDPAPSPGPRHLAESDRRPAGEGTSTAGSGTGEGADSRARLLSVQRAEFYGSRWDEAKGEFVDEPRQAVAHADALVGEVLDELGTLFTEQRRSIERDLDNDDVSTEDLRLALRRYRSFFDRLLSV